MKKEELDGFEKLFEAVRKLINDEAWMVKNLWTAYAHNLTPAQVKEAFDGGFKTIDDYLTKDDGIPDVKAMLDEIRQPNPLKSTTERGNTVKSHFDEFLESCSRVIPDQAFLLKHSKTAYARGLSPDELKACWLTSIAPEAFADTRQAGHESKIIADAQNRKKIESFVETSRSLGLLH